MNWLFDWLIGWYIYMCVLGIYNSLAKLLGDRLKQHLSKKLTKATKFTFLPYLQSQNLCVCVLWTATEKNRKNDIGLFSVSIRCDQRKIFKCEFNLSLEQASLHGISGIELRNSLITYIVIVYIEHKLSLGKCNAYNFIICIKENCLIGVKHRK